MKKTYTIELSHFVKNNHTYLYLLSFLHVYIAALDIVPILKLKKKSYIDLHKTHGHQSCQACNLRFSTRKINKPNKTLAQVFYCEICKNFKNAYFAEHLRRAASDKMIIARLSFKIYCSLKWKMEEYQRSLLLKNFYVSFKCS